MRERKPPRAIYLKEPPFEIPPEPPRTLSASRVRLLPAGPDPREAQEE